MPESLERTTPRSTLWKPEVIERGDTTLEVQTMPLLIGDEDPDPEIRKSNFLKILKTADKRTEIYIGGFANSMLIQEYFTIDFLEELKLVKMSVADFGFAEGATTTEMYAAARNLGFDLVPPETGPRLCLACKDEPPRSGFITAMDPIHDSGGYSGMFCFGRDDRGRRWLDGEYTTPFTWWLPKVSFIFRKADLKPQSTQVSP